MTEPTDLGYRRGGQALFVVVPALPVLIGLGVLAGDLRTELVNLGVVVEDEGGRQYWRRTDRPVEG